ncbi:hypothetical protein [Paenibacillus hubeiensis]|uniref:hypothetical protein n=1 Tax=Paenibacillus hubeiensis TaxID=3077330 RepID=UPI0031BADFCB
MHLSEWSTLANLAKNIIENVKHPFREGFDLRRSGPHQMPVKKRIGVAAHEIRSKAEKAQFALYDQKQSDPSM